MVTPAPADPSLGTGLSDDVLRDRTQRHAVAGPAFRLFIRLADRWRLDVRQRLTLLGDLARPTYYNWASGKSRSLTRDQLERVSLLLGIHKALRLLFADEAAADRWLRAPNTDIEFAGQSPLQRMLQGGIGDLLAVRRYLDAWRGAA